MGKFFCVKVWFEHGLASPGCFCNGCLLYIWLMKSQGCMLKPLGSDHAGVPLMVMPTDASLLSSPNPLPPPILLKRKTTCEEN